MIDRLPDLDVGREAKRVSRYAVNVLRFATNAVQAVADIGHKVTGRETYSEAMNNSHFDQLTDMPNRRRFFHKLDSLLHGDDAPNEILFIQFDAMDFGEINKIYKHETGDSVLRIVGWMFNEAINTAGNGEGVSCIARFGGDEFVAAIANGEQLNIDHPLFVRAIDFGHFVGDKAGVLEEGFSIDFAQMKRNVEILSLEHEVSIYRDLTLLSGKGLDDIRFRFAAGTVKVAPDSSAGDLMSEFETIHGLSRVDNSRELPRGEG